MLIKLRPNFFFLNQAFNKADKIATLRLIGIADTGAMQGDGGTDKQLKSHRILSQLNAEMKRAAGFMVKLHGA